MNHLPSTKRRASISENLRNELAESDAADVRKELMKTIEDRAKAPAKPASSEVDALFAGYGRGSEVA